MEPQRFVLLQRRIVATDAIDDGDEIGEIVVGLRPLLYFVLFGIEILLAARLARGADEALERRSVNAVIRGERGGQHQPDRERGTSAVLQIFGDDVGSVRPRVRTKEVADRRLRDLLEILRELVLGIAPREIRVRLREPRLRQPVHDLRPRKRLGEKDDVRMVLLDRADDPVPERQRLRMRIVDAENAYAFIDPESEDVAQLFPEVAPRVRFEMKRIDVLVLL